MRADGVQYDEVQYHEVARASSERGEIVLRRRVDPQAPAEAPAVLELRVNGVFVMDTVETTSEVALAEAALEASARPARVLVGGLGLGFTARGVLDDQRVERLVVVEIEEALVQWFRDGTVPHGQAFLADARASVAIADVQQVLAEAGPGSFDLVLLDVDNGPDFLVFDSNAAIYESRSLQRVLLALDDRGVLAVWSSTQSPRLEDTIRRVFGSCTSRPCPVVLQGREDVFWLYTAKKERGS